MGTEGVADERRSTLPSVYKIPLLLHAALSTCGRHERIAVLPRTEPTSSLREIECGNNGGGSNEEACLLVVNVGSVWRIDVSSKMFYRKAVGRKYAT